jgi:hypothetical protein
MEVRVTRKSIALAARTLLAEVTRLHQHSQSHTPTSIEPDSDPNYYDYTVPNGFGGGFIVPQFGDYFQAVALNGTLWTSFNATYTAEEGTFQTDPYLAVTSEP